MFSSAKVTRIVVLAVLTIGLASMASAQAFINSGAETIALNASLAESLTLSLSGNAVNFTLAAGSATNPGSGPITATTTWVLKPGRSAVTVNAYFASAAAALTDGTTNIPSSAFMISDNGGAPTALTSATVFNAANAGMVLRNTSITGGNKSATVTDTMTFNIDLSASPQDQLPASVYLGTLNIQAQAAN